MRHAHFVTCACALSCMGLLVIRPACEESAVTKELQELRALLKKN